MSINIELQRYVLMFRSSKKKKNSHLPSKQNARSRDPNPWHKMAGPMVFESFFKLVIFFEFMSDGAISNVRTTRITKIWSYVIQITSYHDTTVQLYSLYITFEIVARNCQTLAYIRLVNTGSEGAAQWLHHEMKWNEMVLSSLKKDR